MVLVADVDVVWLVALALLAHVQAVESRPGSMKWSAYNKGKSDPDYELRMWSISERTEQTDEKRSSRVLEGVWDWMASNIGCLDDLSLTTVLRTIASSANNLAKELQTHGRQFQIRKRREA